jgi:hypothetical protein
MEIVKSLKHQMLLHVMQREGTRLYYGKWPTIMNRTSSRNAELHMGFAKISSLLEVVQTEQIKINSCISKNPFQNAMSCRQNFATMKTSQRPKTAQGESESSRLEYKSPALRKLGKLTHMTLAVSSTSNVADGGMGTTNKTS